MDGRNGSSLESNPFAALFPNVQAAEEYSKQLNQPSFESMETEDTVKNLDSNKISSDDQKDSLVERIFLITNKTARSQNADLPSFSVLIEEEDNDSLHTIIEQLLFSRLLLKNPGQCLKSNQESGDDENDKEQARESRPVVYLLQCYNRVLHEKKYASSDLQSVIASYRALIVMNISTSFISPEIFSELSKTRSDVHRQFYGMLSKNDCLDPTSPPRMCLYEILDYISVNESHLLSTAIEPMLAILGEDMNSLGIFDNQLSTTMWILEAFVGHPSLAEVCVNYIVQKPPNLLGPPAMNMTVFEILLNKSCLSQDPETKMLPFFENAQRMRPSDVEDEEYHLHAKTESFRCQLFAIARLLLKHHTSRPKFLSWIGLFLSKHEYLAKMWTHEQTDVFMNVFGPDASLLNLSSVLVQLSMPFCSEKNLKSPQNQAESQPKFLKIDSSYTHATGQPRTPDNGVHGVNLHKDTCLQSVKEGDSLPIPNSEKYSFISECFFMTHRSIYLGAHGLIKKFYRLNRTLNREGEFYQQIRNSGDSSDMAEIVKKRFESGMRTYLSIKGLLTEPKFLESCICFFGTTTQYLNHIAMTDNMDSIVPVVLPLPKAEPSRHLYFIPEYVIENMTDIILLIWRFARSSIHFLNPYIHAFLLNVSIYMGNKSCMSNPHLRASLAEVLEILLPISGRTEGLSSDQEEIFNKFPHTGFLAVAALQLFVDIEFTGDPNQFEQKFYYRQPLYKILKFLWDREEAKSAMIQEVCKAIENIEDASHPLFLQFTNLLLNDSIYLLDEAMGFLAQIKTMEKERDAGKWDELSEREKMAKNAELKQIGKMAEYHNILSNGTVDTLVYLTRAPEVKDLFSNPALGDRVAAMLDDFLLKLVGPKMSALRVKDLSAYKFKPKVLVMDLCKIYINLCQRDDFCQAISRDGRSYSAKLFPMACQVLRRIGNEDIRDEMWKISEKIKMISNQEEEDEEMFVDAPDEFYDSLMQTVMRDPVILPTSKQVVDRSTISRHLMSDPTDPFNRNPLTMSEVIPDEALKTRIFEWIEEKRKAKAEMQASE